MKSVEELLTEINDAGFRVTELYQRSLDEWFAVLRLQGDFSIGHGQGATAGEALAKAWASTPQNRRMSNAEWAKLNQKPKSLPRLR